MLRMLEPSLLLPVIVAMLQQPAVEPVTHTVANPGPQPAKLIALEFKVPQTHP